MGIATAMFIPGSWLYLLKGEGHFLVSLNMLDTVCPLCTYVGIVDKLSLIYILITHFLNQLKVHKVTYVTLGC